MDDILSDVDRDLDVIFGEYRDQTVVHSFVQAARDAAFTGTLYIGYPVLNVDDERIEFDALLVSRDRGVVVFDLYSYDGGTSESGSIPDSVSARQEQLYAALYNKLNSFRELRRGRNLIVSITTTSIHPVADTWVEAGESLLIGLSRLSELPITAATERLDDEALPHLNAAIQRISNLKPAKKRENVERKNSKGSAIKEIERQIANLDLWQKRGSIEYVNGPQRIRGLAGSGKTVVLALKAAYLHVKRPDWNIVVTFNTRSLYQQFEALINRFVFSQIGEEPDWSKINILHAWGGVDRDGIYSKITQRIGSVYRDFGSAARLFGYERAFDGACKEALTTLGTNELDMYDMILIDEAQDLPSSFFRLVYNLTKTPKRIIWAYDDLQNLGDVHMPSPSELFGFDSRGQPLVTLKNEEDQPQQDIVLPRCYRNPPWTLVAAHGVGFGIKRASMVQMFPDPSLWKRLGYTPAAGQLAYDQDVTLERSPKSIPEFFTKLLDPEKTLNVLCFENAQEQYNYIAAEIKRLIVEDELEHADMLIVIPDVRQARSISGSMLSALRNIDLQGHIPGQTSSRDELFKADSIAITHIFRAKGNEAPVVFVVDAQFCEGDYEIKRKRNILFTAITRSRAWTYVTGHGDGMVKIQAEIESIKLDSFKLSFHYPTLERAEELAVSSDRTQLRPVLSGDDFDDLRIALSKAKATSFANFPTDVQRDIIEVYKPKQ